MKIQNEHYMKSISGNNAAISDDCAFAFTLSSDIKYISGDNKATFIFGAETNRFPVNGYKYFGLELFAAQNGNRYDLRVKLFQNGPQNMGDQIVRDVTVTSVENLINPISYEIKVTDNKELVIKVNNVTHNAVFDKDFVGNYNGGYIGFLTWRSEVEFRNVNYIEEDSSSTVAKFTGISLTNVTLTPAYSVGIPNYTGEVSHEIESIDFISKTNGIGILKINNIDAVPGTPVTVNLKTGTNRIPVTITNTASNVTRTVMVNIRKKAHESERFTEKYRPQYHVTPECNWLNDPNGMVYYNGEYHLFYQYYPYSKFPEDVKYWAHVASKDLVHWEERPIALVPDKYGSIWSGSAVVDENNTSGLFDEAGNESRLAAFYTVTKLGSFQQRQSMAISKDGGDTWEKYNDGAPIIDSDDDPLRNHGFRDPKVFWHNESNQWMMVVAGGPLRFYSSKNLIDWKPEGIQSEIETECPDFYKLNVDDDSNNTKWILSNSGVTYMIGDFRQVNGVWKFIPDTTERFPFNYAPDAYAAQSFANTPDGRIININWMVTVAYPFETGEITDPWNGAMTLPYEIKLKNVDGRLRIIQSPVKELEILRKEEFAFISQQITPETINPLRNIQANTYEINATIDVGTAREFGFKLRIGPTQYTEINYNTTTNMFSLDRSRSGAIPKLEFSSVYSTKIEPQNGKIKLQIYVDNSSVEVFVQDGIYLYTALIFPDTESAGLEIFTKDGNITIDDMKIYKLKSMYKK